MNKFTRLIISLILIFSFMGVSSFAVNICINYEFVTYDDAFPFIEDNRTFIPVRVVAEHMGADVSWDNETQTVSITKSGDTMIYEGKEYPGSTVGAKFVIGQKSINISLTYNNGVQVFSVDKEMDVSARIIEGRTYIPARYLGYALGYDVKWNQAYGKMDYIYIAEQTLDFEGSSDNAEKIRYEYDKEKYPDILVINNVQWPSRKGYNGIEIVDVTASRKEGTKLINFFLYRFTHPIHIIECDEPEYIVDNSNTRDENFRIYSKFYTDKTTEEVDVTESKYSNYYFPAFLTNERCGGYNETYDGEGLYSMKYGWDGYDYIDTSKRYYCYTNPFPTFDFSKTYFINEIPLYGLGPWYGSTENDILTRGSDKNALLFLNTFLGETGQRIWFMMFEYYQMIGYSYIAPNTELDKPIVLEGGYHVPDGMPGLTTETVEKYGLTVVDNRRVSALKHLLTLKTDEQIIYIEYNLMDIMSPDPGYSILFEKIEK